MSFLKKILYVFIFILIIISLLIILYYYIKNYIEDIFINYEQNIQKLQGITKLKNEQHILRNFVYGKKNYNKRFLVNNLLNNYEIIFLKKIFKLYSKNILPNKNKQININLINNFGKLPLDKDILCIEKIINKVKKKIELLYFKELKLSFYILSLCQKGNIVYPHSDCKSFNINSKNFINNMCPDRHYVVVIPLNNYNYNDGKFKFCNNNKIINIKQGQGLIYDGREIYEITEIKNNKKLNLYIWFSKI